MVIKIVYAVPVQWKVEDGGNDHFYDAISFSTNWEGANNAAQALGGGWHLATVTSQGENDFIYSLVSGDSSFWIENAVGTRHSEGPWLGGFRIGPTEHDYAWVTGEPFNYTNWAPLEPFDNGDRIALFGFNTSMGPEWNDVPATRSTRGYVIETSMNIDSVAEPTTFALLVFGLIGIVFIRRHRGEHKF